MRAHLCKFATGVNVSSSKFAAGVNNIGGKFSLVSTTLAVNLKVPKRENFLLAFFAQTKPIWVCDLEIKKKIKI